jgi:hypothetical protein
MYWTFAPVKPEQVCAELVMVHSVANINASTGRMSFFVISVFSLEFIRTSGLRVAGRFPSGYAASFRAHTPNHASFNRQREMLEPSQAEPVVREPLWWKSVTAE